MTNTPRACILSVSGPELTSNEFSFLSEMNPWGVILMGRSCKKRDQVRRLVDDIWRALGRACLIFIDQEGGRVARLKPPEWPVFPAPAKYGALYDLDMDAGLEAVELGHRLIAHQLTQIGIHANCAPVLDLPQPDGHDIVGDRALGKMPDQIAMLARAALKGFERGGVAGVIKHMPGHGRAVVDSHEELPVIDASIEQLSMDFIPFTLAQNAPMGMTCHVALTAIDGETPTTHSSKIISEVIRGRIGFDGCLMTDDLGMQALGGTLGTRASKALEAGCDIALHCSGFLTDPDVILQEMTEVAEASSPLTGKSLERARAAEARALKPEPFDSKAGWMRFYELISRTEVAV